MTMNSQPSTPDVVALRPFVPAKDFEKSLQFYVDLGFSAHRLGDSLASMELGSFGFLLQKFDVKGFAGNFMMQMMVNDVAGWWKRIESLDLPGKYGVKAPGAPALQPWGLTVAYVVDPSGVLWHIAQNPD
jgi:catechol 2,3-dioxygenase-like lactoylglutathione lyase family enzyme